MYEWSRKRTWIGGEPIKNDWIVMRLGEEVGRVRLDRGGDRNSQPWQWHKTTVPGENGKADSLDQALEAVREAVVGEAT
jgi:hypothetical protein